MDREQKARNNHRNMMNCAQAVYQAFSDVNPNATAAPMPREEGGKCGAVLAAEKLLVEMGKPEKAELFDERFLEKFGSLKCRDLRGQRNGVCNNYVGTAAQMVEQMI